MGEIMNPNSADLESANVEQRLEQITQEFLTEARSTLENKKTLSVPIAELATLGGGISSLIPAFNMVTQTTTIPAEGIYRLVNGTGLRAAQNDLYWGSTTARSMAKFESAGSLTSTTKTVAAFNPATMMMAVALISIEHQLGNIEKMQKEILSFLEIEKEAEIEADVETLMGIVHKYKINWDNEHYVAGNHKLMLDIQRTARKNLNAYQKKISEALSKKQLIVAQTTVNQAYSNLAKMFMYYRLSLYIFSLASLMEIMLSGNFKEEYITGIRQEIQTMTDTYRGLFEQASQYLEKLGKAQLEANLVKGVGVAGKAVGKVIGSIPIINKGPVDDLLQGGGSFLTKNASDMEKKAVHQFASISNPGTGDLMNLMSDMIQIYDHTDEICFDNERIYLVAN